jgi:hypothetical protein
MKIRSFRNDVARAFKPDRVDVPVEDEQHQIQRAPGFQFQVVDFLGLEQHVLAVPEGEALDDFVRVDRTDAGDDLLIVDALARGSVDLMNSGPSASADRGIRDARGP